MTRKSGKQTSARDEKSETWFPEGGAKSAGDPGLNKAINAAEGGQTDPDSPLETPENPAEGQFSFARRGLRRHVPAGAGAAA
jgi:hypothetical protein